MSEESKAMLKGAGSALLYLVAFLAFAFAIGFGLSALRIHYIEQIGFTIVLILCVAGGALWGRALARIAGHPDERALMLANSVSYGPAVILIGVGLGQLERVLVEQSQPSLPIHVLFEILFTTASFVVVAVNGLANGIALKSARLSARLALLGGAAGALGFVIPTLILDTLGRRVGAPRAAETATMLTNMLVGIMFAAATAGAALTALIRRHVAQNAALASMPPSPAG